ncbi:tRNA modification GTPase GTPBP3, mitochondrial [Musca vetustissima]|uniref:tRNA modification GTPase GTPBP3, mitochondrial n=1 Tax=Musca vetustissima TaxID=27455 RepID=UPI002AB6C6AB|nr:tRNA modification GTPase GTPBP3, mitochondrial [Musca vetustissima]
MLIFRKLLKLTTPKRYASASTIYALSSAYGKCGVSVIRVSGPQTRKCLSNIVGSVKLKERHAHLKALYHPKTNEMIDKGLVLWFPGPSSFTGEDCCEFQVHGSIAVISAMLDALSHISGLRPANPGEFTKRAFFGNKLDLTEVEGLADLIHAETEAQRKQALQQSNGSLSRLYDNWRKRLIRCAAHLEAYIDFGEDENIEEDIVVQLSKELKNLQKEITVHLNDQRQGEMLRDGVRTCIIGAPNVGKSSLLNYLCQKDVAIVSPIAGTTRDAIESTLSFGGYPVRIVDTAGLRSFTTDTIEQQGILKTKKSAEDADLILLITDAAHFKRMNSFTGSRIESYCLEYLKELDLDQNIFRKKRVQLIVNKIDILSKEEVQALTNLPNVIGISCKENYNMLDFMARLENILRELCGSPLAEAPRLTHARYRVHLERCIEHIKEFLEEYSPDVFPDMAISALKLRNAIKDIERITGHVSTDDILDVVFKDFCIGK